MSLKTAELFSKKLGVRRSFLLCEDDLKTSDSFINAFGESIDSSMNATIDYLKNLGFQFKFNCVPFSNKDIVEKYSEDDFIMACGEIINPLDWKLYISDTEHIPAALKSIDIAYENFTINLSYGKFIDFLAFIDSNVVNIIENFVKYQTEGSGPFSDAKIKYFTNPTQKNKELFYEKATDFVKGWDYETFKIYADICETK